MEPTHFRQANLVLTGPEGSDIIPLPVLVNADENTMSSLWVPNEEERQCLIDGGAVIVQVYGGAHPPIKVGAAAIEWGEHHVPEDEAPIAT